MSDGIEAGAEGKGGYAKAASAEQTEKIKALLHAAAVQSDIVITTALIGGRTAPRLIETDTVKAMKAGSVVVDLAVEGGGNVACSERGAAIQVNGVWVLGYTNLVARMPFDASRLYARNVLNLLNHFHGKEGYVLDLADEITGEVALMHAGQGRVAAMQPPAASPEPGAS